MTVTDFLKHMYAEDCNVYVLFAALKLLDVSTV